MRRTIVVSVLFALIACNAISGLDQDFVLAPIDGGTTGEPDATTTDSATTDGSSTSDVVTVDAPIDGGGPTDAFSCTNVDAAFCTDFETDAAWDDSELDQGTVVFELDAGLGGTRGMHAHVNDAPGTSRRAALWKRISGADAKTYVHYDVGFDFMIAGKSFPYSAIGIMGLTQPAGGGGLRFYGAASFGDKTLDVADDDPVIVPDKIGVADTFGTWHRAFISLDREGGGTYGALLQIDGTTVDVRGGFDFGDAQTAELRLGILFTSTTSGTMDLYVDNVIVHRTK